MCGLPIRWSERGQFVGAAGLWSAVSATSLPFTILIATLPIYGRCIHLHLYLRAQRDWVCISSYQNKYYYSTLMNFCTSLHSHWPPDIFALFTPVWSHAYLRSCSDRVPYCSSAQGSALVSPVAANFADMVRCFLINAQLDYNQIHSKSRAQPPFLI